MTKFDDLKGKVVIISGASKGIGREMVSQFADQGAIVAFCARSVDSIHEFSRELKVRGHECYGQAFDVTSEEDVQRFIDGVNSQYGKIDILINNAGSAGPTRLLQDWSLSEWEDTLRNLLNGVFLMTRSVVPIMIKNKAGSIVNISSVSGKRALNGRIGYTTGKMGVMGFTRTAAAELGPFGIRVNSICPGAVSGERLDGVLREQARIRGVDEQVVLSEFVQSAPLRSVVPVEDVCTLAMFLASEASKTMTGQDINVSAGVVMY